MSPDGMHHRAAGPDGISGPTDRRTITSQDSPNEGAGRGPVGAGVQAASRGAEPVGQGRRPVRGGRPGRHPGGPLKVRPANGREAAFLALVDAETGQAYVDQALGRVLAASTLPLRERALATELAYGVARRLGTLDWALGFFLHRPMDQVDAAVRVALRLGLYQLWYLDRIPDHAAVSESVALVRRHGPARAAGFVNGVLRSITRTPPQRLPWPDPAADPVGHLSLTEAHPRWLVERWWSRLGPEETRELVRANNRIPPLTARVNRLRADRDALLAELTAAGLEAEPGRYLPEAVVLGHGVPAGELPAFREGRLTWQDESSMLVVHVLDPRPGEMVLDVAAAPGGKTTHVAERMADQGRVVACDVSRWRLRQVGENARRLGLQSIETQALDARELPARYGGQADRVLADVPCSGFGVVARRPDLRWRKGPEDLEGLAQLQGQLLRAAAACVRPGGVLVYSTCTTEPEENQGVVQAFLDQAAGEFEGEDLRRWLPPSLWAEPGVREGWLQLWPHRHGVDGFFLARLRRRTS